jgi:hypothetical protein
MLKGSRLVWERLMSKPRYLLVLALATGLAACVAQILPPGGGDPMPADACNARQMQGLVSQPASVLAAMTFSRQTRVIRPGMMITEDYSTSRLNIYLDAADVIWSVSCG